MNTYIFSKFTHWPNEKFRCKFSIYKYMFDTVNVNKGSSFLTFQKKLVWNIRKNDTWCLNINKLGHESFDDRLRQVFTSYAEKVHLLYYKRQRVRSSVGPSVRDAVNSSIFLLYFSDVNFDLSSEYSCLTSFLLTNHLLLLQLFYRKHLRNVKKNNLMVTFTLNCCLNKV